jgi:hypothetical protein
MGDLNKVLSSLLGNTCWYIVKNKTNDKIKSMTVGEIMKSLIMADEYNEVRVNVSDEFINMAKTMLGDFKYIEEKEEKYQELIKIVRSNIH